MLNFAFSLTIVKAELRFVAGSKRARGKSGQ